MFITQTPIALEQWRGPPDRDCGAQVIFAGVVRAHNHGKRVRKLYYECFSSMAESQIARIVRNVRERTGVEKIFVLHRIGLLEVGETALLVVVESPHRQEAFTACQQVIEAVKTRVPIWKKEFYEDGTMEWAGACCAPVVSV